MRRRAQLTDDELIRCCLDHGIRLDVPYSQLDAEAVWRGVDLAIVVRLLLRCKLERAEGR